MSVLFLAPHGRSVVPHSPCWRPQETRELLRLFGAFRKRADARSFEFGETEPGDPQFYILGAAPDQPCLAFVSRIRAHDRCWYLVQDGGGAVTAEGESLRTVVDGAVARIGRTRSAPYLAPVWGLLLSCDLGFWPALNDCWTEAAASPLVSAGLQMAL
jgi:hypothetical protein